MEVMMINRKEIFDSKKVVVSVSIPHLLLRDVKRKLSLRWGKDSVLSAVVSTLLMEYVYGPED